MIRWRMLLSVTAAIQDHVPQDRAPSVETVRVKLPPSFSPTNPTHAAAVTNKVNEAHGGGFALSHIDGEYAVLTRRSYTTEVVRGADDSFFVKLPNGTKPTDGDRMAATLQEQHPGYYLTRFDPHNGKAGLTRLADDEVRCREAVAGVIGAKPWDVTVAKTPDGGYLLGLTNKYVPSKHDEKLAEVATRVVGKFGWYVETDPARLTAKIVPSDPPTFPEIIPLDLSKLGKGNPFRSPFGLKLPALGQVAKEPIEVDWKSQAFALVSGLPGAGKTIALNALLAHQFSSGAQVAILDDKAKSTDFLWAKPYVRDGGWGCDGLRSSITALALVYAEGQRRAEVLKTTGYTNWLDMPETQRFAPIFVVVDEVSALLVTERLPAGVDKKLPEVQEVIEENRLKFKLQRLIFKTVAELRFVGVRMVLSTQVTNTNTGLPPTLKALIGHKILQGTNPSKTQRQQAFNVEANVPEVPENLRGGGLVAKGVGAAELEAQAPAIYKGFYSTTDSLVERFRELGLPTTSRPEPTEAEMNEYCPVGDLNDEEPEPDILGTDRTPSGKPLDPKYGPTAVYDDDGRPLKGAAAAARASKVLAAVSDAPGPLCPSCDSPIRPNGECGCSW